MMLTVNTVYRTTLGYKQGGGNGRRGYTGAYTVLSQLDPVTFSIRINARIMCRELASLHAMLAYAST